MHATSLFIRIVIKISGANLNPAPDNTRINQPPNPSINNPGMPPVDPNNVFGNPNRQAPNPWENIPIFPAPTNNPRAPQYPQYPQYPQNPQYPPNPNYPNTPFGQPPQFPFAFGNPPPQVPAYRTTPPSLLDQFLYNKSGGKNAAATIQLPSNIIYVISALVVSLITLRRNHYLV